MKILFGKLIFIDYFTESSGQARGRTYVISFPDNSKSDGSASDLDTLELYISPQNTEVRA